MRRTAGMLLALALAVPLASLTPASAHTTFHITGFQYLYNDDFDIGIAGYVSTPAGPVRVNSGVSTDVLETVVNRDAVPHTFTECTANCDAPVPSFENARFDVALEPGTSADIAALVPGGTVFFACQVHPWMRGTAST